MLTIGPEVADVVLRALKMVATASRGLDMHERELLAAAASVLGADVDHETLAPIDPDEAGRVVPDEVGRTRLIEAMMLMALMDQEVDAAELAVIDRFARAWGVD